MKIAIVKLSSLGDIIHAMVALQFIKRSYPDSKIDWIVEEKYKGLLENNLHLENIYTVNLQKAKKRKSIFLLFKELKKIRKLKDYDFVIDAQGLLKSAIVAKMISTKQNVGFDKKSIREPMAAIFYNQKVSVAYDENSIERNVAVICNPLNISLQSTDIIDKNPFIISSSKNQTSRKTYIVFVIGSTWESRNYPKEKYVEIANKLQKRCLAIWGNDSEKIKAKWMALQSEFIEVAPKLTLDELKGVIKNSTLLIGNDTGPSHMAWAMNLPSIILFGPTPINRVYQTKINRVLKSSSKVDQFNLDKNDYSIKEIRVDEVVKISKELLEVNL
jgi:heptosyltransferase-1